MSAPAPAPFRYLVDAGASYSVSVLGVGLACCAVEFAAASFAFPPATGEPVAEVMVVSGTVTDRMAPAIRRLYDALPEPRYVISFGSCANSGGPYWDSYSVTKGVDQLVPVDLYVPGCPPRPEALLAGLRALHDTVAR